MISQLSVIAILTKIAKVGQQENKEDFRSSSIAALRAKAQVQLQKITFAFIQNQKGTQDKGSDTKILILVRIIENRLTLKCFQEHSAKMFGAELEAERRKMFSSPLHARWFFQQYDLHLRTLSV